MPYIPRYVDTNEIPIQIPDDYSDEQKRQALEVAEGEAELDLNDAERFDTEELPRGVLSKIETAVKQKATGELAQGAEDPNDVTLGDIEDSGTNKSDYAQRFHDRYNEIVAKIRNSGVLDSTRDDSPYVYNTRGRDERLEGENVDGMGGGSYQGQY